jgi:hypothetical protein
MMDLNSVESIDDFIEQIIGNLIPIIYQKYPYLKDSLLLIYKACEELLVLLKEDNKSSGNDYDLGARATYAVFRNLPRFSKCFEKSLQRGPIKWGFLRTKKIMAHWVIFAPFRFVFLRLCNNLFGCNKVGNCCQPVSTEIKVMSQNVSHANNALDSKLKREARDLKELFHATMESAFASAIYFVGCGSFMFAILITGDNILSAILKIPSAAAIDSPTTAMNYIQVIIVEGATLISTWTALLALTSFVSLLKHQRRAGWSIRRLANAPRSVRAIKTIANVQSLVSIIQCVASIGSIVSLVIGFFFGRQKIFETEISDLAGILGADDSRQFVLYCTLLSSSLDLWKYSSIICRIHSLYRLTPTGSEDVCQSFRHELNELYNEYSLSRDKNSTMPPPKEERIVWEHTARDFLSRTRFDSVLGANRFSALMQCIQSGDASSWRKNEMKDV